MSKVTSIFKLADILHTPQGFVLAGTFSSKCQQLKDILNQVNSYVNGLHSVSYLNDDRELVSLSVKDVQYTTSISNQVNLFFLLDFDHLPHDLTLGTIIYNHEQQTSTVLVLNTK